MKITLSDGQDVFLQIPENTYERIKGTCFRGKQCSQAGNSCRWHRIVDFKEDPVVHELLGISFLDLVKNGAVSTSHRIVLEFQDAVGWDSVLSYAEVPEEYRDKLVRKELNKRSHALFLPDNLVKAPLTSFLTLVVRMYHDRHWRFVLHTIYPGNDVGELRGDMTKKHNYVWLNWSNPGE